MAEGNGRQDNLSRLDRIEAAMEMFVADHEDFRQEHKRLLAAQIVLQDAQRKTEQMMQDIGDKLNGLIGLVDRDHREFHERLKRLETKN